MGAQLGILLYGFNRATPATHMGFTACYVHEKLARIPRHHEEARAQGKQLQISRPGSPMAQYMASCTYYMQVKVAPFTHAQATTATS